MPRILIRELAKKTGEEVRLCGFVDTRRDHGKLIFFDLRDATGKIQCVVTPEKATVHAAASEMRPEWVVTVEGKITPRPEKMTNAEEPNGIIELQVERLEIVTKAATPPFDLTGEGRDIGEERRMTYRYLDLRRPRMRENLRRRHEAALFLRNYLAKEDFIEIETPLLTKTTPEGARDFLVPSRLHPGSFYALPQSPQQYKQLLMVAGFERYFQFARVFRDEDSRADRAFGEFTQLDLEMSFVTQEDILALTEKMFTTMVENIFPEKKISKKPWPRLSHREAVEKYGTDKPDLRRDKKDPGELAFSWTLDFPLFTEQSAEDFYHGSGSAKFAPSHHMFTAPHPDDLPLLETAPTKVRGLQHDLVLNGFEVGGGSIRIHDPAVQKKVFELIGFSVEQKKLFEHMLTAFTYGVPPHGGIAPGFDRLMMALLGEPNLREVMAFPKTGDGRDLMMGAPGPVTEAQLKELGLTLKQERHAL